MWTCPNCGRSFQHEAQFHSCAIIGLDEHLKNRPQEIVELFDELISRLRQFGDFKIEPVKGAIMLRKSASFLSVRVQMKCLDISFKANHHLEEFPVYKSLQMSSKSWAHAVKIESLDELDAQLLGWIKDAYDMIPD